MPVLRRSSQLSPSVFSYLVVCQHAINRLDGHECELPEDSDCFLGCEPKADKDDHFKVDNDGNEHQLPLRMVSLGDRAKG